MSEVILYSHPTRPSRSYRGTSLMKERLLLGPFGRAMPRALWWS